MCFFIFRPYCHSQREYVISAAGSTGSASGSSSTPAASTPGCGCRLLLAGAGAGLLGLGGTANAKCGPGGGGRETCQRILLLLIHRAFCFTTSEFHSVVKKNRRRKCQLLRLATNRAETPLGCMLHLSCCPKITPHLHRCFQRCSGLCSGSSSPIDATPQRGHTVPCSWSRESRSGQNFGMICSVTKLLGPVQSRPGNFTSSTASSEEHLPVTMRYVPSREETYPNSGKGTPMRIWAAISWFPRRSSSTSPQKKGSELITREKPHILDHFSRDNVQTLLRALLQNNWATLNQTLSWHEPWNPDWFIGIRDHWLMK